MANSTRIEAAAGRMAALAGSDIAKKLRGANEATTRLLIIDEVLDILGWPKMSFDRTYALIRLIAFSCHPRLSLIGEIAYWRAKRGWVSPDSADERFLHLPRRL